MKIGYARDAISAPLFHVQLAKLKAAGCKTIFTSIKLIEKSDPMDKFNQFIREGEDVIVICSLRCLDKSLKDLVNFFHQLEKLQLSLESIEDNFVIDKNNWHIAFSSIHLYQRMKHLKYDD